MSRRRAGSRGGVRPRSGSVAWPRQSLPVTARPIADARLDLHGVLDRPTASRRRPASRPTSPRVVDAAILSRGHAAGDAGRAPLTDVRETAAGRLRRHATIGADARQPRPPRAVIDRLVADGHLVRDGAGWLCPGRDARHCPGPTRSLDAMDRLERSLGVAAPPPLSEAAAAAGCPTEGIRELERTGRIVVLDDDLAYATTTYRRDHRRPRSGSPRPRRSRPAALRDATGTSRKYVMAILEDSIGAGSCAGPRTATSRAHGPARSRGDRAMTARRVTGLVLAGGRSSRFGRDKLAERIDGRTLLDSAIDGVTPASTEILVVAAPDARPGPARRCAAGPRPGRLRRPARRSRGRPAGRPRIDRPRRRR